jgi:2-hydroxy-6-oxonona-2,4-dienedioate hydrolase
MHVWRDDASRERLEAWHGRFRARIETPVVSEVVDTSFGSSHVLIAGLGEAPPLVCLHAMRTGSAHLLSELQSLATRFRLVASDVPGQSVRGPQVRVSLAPRRVEVVAGRPHNHVPEPTASNRTVML